MYYPAHISSAAGASAGEYQHPGADPGTDLIYACHTPTPRTPDGIQNLKLNIAGYGLPDGSGAGGEVIARFKKRPFAGIFLPNQTFTDFAVKQTMLNYLFFPEKACIHYGGRCHRHIPGGAA